MKKKFVSVCETCKRMSSEGVCSKGLKPKFKYGGTDQCGRHLKNLGTSPDPSKWKTENLNPIEDIKEATKWMRGE